MLNKIKTRTPILALILFLFAVGYTVAANKVVVIPMGSAEPDAEKARWAMIQDGVVITQSGGILAIKDSDGHYFINFGNDVTSHAIIASGTDQNFVVGAIICGNDFTTTETFMCKYPYNTKNYVYVRTYRPLGAAPPTPFYVTVLP